MIQSKKITVVIPSAGLGKRMNGLPGLPSKQYAMLQHKPMLAHTLEKFERSKYADEIVIVCAKEGISFIQEKIVAEFHCRKVGRIVVGGKQRQDSVYEGLKACVATDIVLVHDGVRPFVTTEKIDELIETCVRYRAAILAVPLKDTVKMQDADQNIRETLDRGLLWSAQTPQAFEYPLLLQAFQKAYSENFYGTDEAVLVERLGEKVRIVRGEYENIKITTPDDWALADIILKKSLRAP
jgi:2-C-methyl-D-erythritol 4-phosphate cytidylyltransferase